MKFWCTIRGRLFLIVLIAILPALGVILWIGYEQHYEAMRNAEQKTLFLARNFAQQQQEITASTEQILRTLADVHHNAHHDSVACRKILRNIKERNPTYRYLFVADPDGLVQISSEGNARLNVADRKYFRDAVETKSFSAGEYVISGEPGGNASLHFAYPQLDWRGEVCSVFVAAVNLETYWDFVERVNFPGGYVFGIVDHRGVRLFRHPDRLSPMVGRGIAVSEESLRQITSGRSEGLYETAGSDGIIRIYAFRKLYHKSSAQPYMTVVVGADKAVVLAKENETLLLQLLVLGLTLMVVIISARLIGDASIVNHIKRLVEATRRLREGNLAARSKIPPGKGEIGELAQSFDEMAQALEQMKAEQTLSLSALRDSEERFRLTFENSLDAVVLAVPGGPILAVNSAACSLFGYTEEEMMALPPNGPADKEDPNFAAFIRERVSKGCARGEYRNVRKGGTLFEAEVTSTTFTKSNGDEHVVVIIRDITERRRAEQQIKDSERKYRQLFELISDAIFLIEKDTGRILEVNAAATGLYGYSREELLRMRNVDLSAEPEKTARATREETSAIPIRYHRCKDGTVIPVEITASHFSWQGSQVHIATIRDIRERLKSQEALSKSEERYRGIFENTIVGIFQSTTDGRYLTVNKALAGMFGYDSPEQMITSVTDIGAQLYYDPEERRRAMKILTATDRLVRFETRFRRRDGLAIWAVINSRSVKDANGQVLFIEGIIEDITERRKVEEALIQSEERFSKAFRSSPILQAMTTLYEGRIIDVNDKWLEITGHSRDEVIGRTTVELGVWADEDDRRAVVSRIAKGESLIDVPVKVRTK
ncbi:MAG: PAS domain S-box protein, partial [Deltaproteobacteria bacterium]|nr:PAS domain S-box protein [Deltaproteobacteria bacterium]